MGGGEKDVNSTPASFLSFFSLPLKGKEKKNINKRANFFSQKMTGSGGERRGGGESLFFFFFFFATLFDRV